MKPLSMANMLAIMEHPDTDLAKQIDEQSLAFFSNHTEPEEYSSYDKLGANDFTHKLDFEGK